MPGFPRFFSWVFATVAISAALSLVLRVGAYHRYYDSWHRSWFAWIAFECSFIFLFAKAWWTNWRQEPNAKVWGVCATSIMTGLVVFAFFRNHRRINNLIWEIGVLNVLALIAYLWPDAESHLLPKEPDEETYRVPND